MVDQTSRREALRLLGAASTALVAGCSSPSSDDGGNDDASDSEDSTQSSGGGDDDSTDDSTNDGGTDDGSNDDGSTDDSDSGSVDPAQWEGVETIRLRTDGTVWRGAEPEMIADRENPTLVLYEGNQYEFVYENADGGYHNLELWDENGDVVDGYSTEIVSDNGAERTLDVEATSDLATYVCNPHSSSMNGEIRIE